ncbi:MAG TPA: hypothetical protein PKI32_05675 [Opitutales bacterium]|nr:hypothetical protein [Opitutales bacterium]
MYARIAKTFALLALAILVSGCTTQKKNSVPREAYQSKYTPRNVAGLPKIPATVRRVVVLPIYWDRDADSDFVADLDVIFQLALQRTNAFEIVPVPRAQMYKFFHAYQLSSVQVLPDDLMQVLKTQYAADAVLFLDLTVNRPYRPISIGIRARLVEIDGKSMIWAVDSIFDSADPAVARAALDFSNRSTFNRYPVDSTGGILMSPRAFAGFAADTLFGTLPPR